MERATRSATHLEESPTSNETHLDAFVKSILLRRWKPPDEWQLVEVVNERFSSQPASSSESLTISNAPTTSPQVSCLSTTEMLFPQSTTSCTEALADLSTWLSQNRQPHQRVWAALNDETLKPGSSMPNDLKQFTSCGHLKLSAMKSLGRRCVSWDTLHCPADLKPFFNLCEQLESSPDVVSSGVVMREGETGNGIPTSGAVTPMVISSSSDYLTGLWCNSVDLNNRSDVEAESIESTEKDFNPWTNEFIQKGHAGNWESSPNLALTKIHVKYPSPIQLQPYVLLCALLSPLSLAPGTMLFWSRAFFEYNILAALPRLDWYRPPAPPKNRKTTSSVTHNSKEMDVAPEEPYSSSPSPAPIASPPRKRKVPKAKVRIPKVVQAAVKSTASKSPPPSKKRTRPDPSPLIRAKIKRPTEEGAWPVIPTERQAAIAKQMKNNSS